jgi:hypothetical protein
MGMRKLIKEPSKLPSDIINIITHVPRDITNIQMVINRNAVRNDVIEVYQDCGL